MKVFWNNATNGNGVPADIAYVANLDEVNLIWSDHLNGAVGTFLGLIDDNDRTAQFYFEKDIPDHIDDAGFLEIVWFDFPCPEEGGSYGKMVRIDDVYGLIESVFKEGANHDKFMGLSFQKW